MLCSVVNDPHSSDPHPLKVIRDSAPYLIRAAYRRANELFDQKIRGSGLTRPQFMLLWTAYLAPDLEQAELAEFAGFDLATAAGILSRLEKLGLITRSPSGRSRRGRAVRPSPSGEAVIRQSSNGRKESQAVLFAGFTTEEQQQFLHLISRLAGVRNSYNAG